MPTTKETWKPSTGNRIASVNSFGFGGSNVHVVLQEANADSQDGIVNGANGVNAINGVNGVHGVNGVNGEHGLNDDLVLPALKHYKRKAHMGEALTEDAFLGEGLNGAGADQERRPLKAPPRVMFENNDGDGVPIMAPVPTSSPVPPTRCATNGHTKASEVAPLSRRLYIMSAKSEQSLLHYASNMATYLERDEMLANPDYDKSLAYTLGNRRSRFQWRLAVNSASPGDLAQALEGQKMKPTRASGPPTVCFIFTGQGAQWLGMGRELIAQYPVFATSIRRADDCCVEMGAGWSLEGKPIF